VTCRPGWRDGAALALVIGLGALLSWEASGLDLALVRVYGDASGFAWRDAWLTRAAGLEGRSPAGKRPLSP
jgi:hypothetical protein